MKKIFGILAVVLLVSGCASFGGVGGHYVPVPDGKYDNHAYMVDPGKMSLEAVKDSVGVVITKAVFKVKTDEKKSFSETLKSFGIPMPPGSFKDEAKRDIEGSGVVLFGRYFMTEEHVVNNPPLTMRLPFETVFLPYEKFSEKSYLRLQNGKDKKLAEMRPLYIDRKNDVALFEFDTPKNAKIGSFPYALGNSDDLRIGNFTYVVGRPQNLGVNVREGIVSALYAPEEVVKFDAVPKNAVMISNGLLPGDSGTLVLAIRDGRYELVGLSQGTFSEGGNSNLGWAIRINVIRDLLLKAPGVPAEFKKLLKNE